MAVVVVVTVVGNVAHARCAENAANDDAQDAVAAWPAGVGNSQSCITGMRRGSLASGLRRVMQSLIVR